MTKFFDILMGVVCWGGVSVCIGVTLYQYNMLFGKKNKKNKK